MPTYEYACKACGEHLEVVQSFKDDPLTTCASCGGALRKVFGSIGIAFKGSGFYKTDSRSSTDKSEKKAASGDGGSSSTDKSSSSSDSAAKSGDKAGKSGDKAGKSGDKAAKPSAAASASA